MATFGLRVIKPEEVTTIVNDFADPGSLAPTRLYIGGTKYMVIQGEPGAVIRGKKVKNVYSFFSFLLLLSRFSCYYRGVIEKSFYELNVWTLHMITEKVKKWLFSFFSFFNLDIHVIMEA